MDMPVCGNGRTREREVMDFLSMALADMRAVADRMYHVDAGEYARTLDAIAVKAARMAEYLESRGGDGCGDSGHEAAVSASNRRAARVRKALGYTYPRDDVHF